MCDAKRACVLAVGHVCRYMRKERCLFLANNGWEMEDTTHIFLTVLEQPDCH